MKILQVLSIVLIVFFACKKSPSTEKPDPVNPPVDHRKLIETANFKIGTAVTSTLIKNEAIYDQTLKGEFNQITAEFEMKMNRIWTAADSYNFEKVDYLVNYAQQNKLEVHGHTLLWYKSFPEWFMTANYDSVMFESRVKKYITTVVSRYKGKIRSWDVANEIFNDDGTLRIEPMMQGKFKDPIGFIGRCFQYTKLADPEAKLFYNDYSVFVASGKRTAMKEMAMRFKKEGIPIDGLGEQFHYSLRTNQTSISSGFKDLAASGLLIHISEIDSKVNVDRSDLYVFTSTDKQKQSDYFRNIARLYNALPASQKFAMTLWGISDKDSWIRDKATGHPKEYPLLFDDGYNKKTAYSGFLEGLK